jgi:cytochrome P450
MADEHHMVGRWTLASLSPPPHGPPPPPPQPQDGTEWYHQRKTSSHLFRQANFKTGMLAAFNKAGGDFLGNLEAQRRSGKPVNMSATFFALTLDVISEVAFGQELRTLRWVGRG